MGAPEGTFQDSTVEKAFHDIRNLVWLPSLNDYNTPSQYFKSFKSYEDLFLNAPRVRLGGAYLLKEKYYRKGVRENNQIYDPLHEIEFYRYFRFFPTGLVMSCLSVNKLKEEKLKRIFTIDDNSLEEETFSKTSKIKSIMYGEYIVQKSNLYIKLCSSKTVYEYQIEINQTSQGMFDQLKLNNESMRAAGQEISSFISNEFVGDKIFKFIPIASFLRDLENNLGNMST